MSNLLIIGNGFDISHDMLTSYKNFHEFLQNEYDAIDEENKYVPGINIGHHGENVLNHESIIGLICCLVNEVASDFLDWSDFEDALGKIDLISCFDDLPILIDSEGDRDFIHESYNNEDRGTELYVALEQINVYFSKWISSVKLAKHKKKDFVKLINPQKDIFLNFNYTKTLEELYDCKNVYHIHGVLGEELLFGHNNKSSDYSEDNRHVPIGASETLIGINEMLRKNTETILNDSMEFFSRLSKINIEKIYSYGFSFSDIDIIYIQEICNRIDSSKISWYFNDFDSEQKISCYKSKVLKCGFNGSFDTYHVNF